ncbi:MAG: hypothetical protein N2C12_15920 [Planctomycetales bacterium]
MPRVLTAVLGIVIGTTMFCAALGAQNAPEPEQPHAIFADLQVGQMVNVTWEEGGCVISDWGGIKKVAALGPDYIVYTETGNTYFVYINQIKMVTIRPG